MANIYYGVNSEFIVISKTHGKYSLGFVENFEVDVSHTNKRLFFFNKKEALAISVFEGVSGRFGFLETEEKYLVSALMDIDPSTITIPNDDPSAYNEFNVILNVKNESGVIEHGVFVKGCRISGLPETLAPREEQHGTCAYIAATRYKLKGGGIQYSRIVSSAPAYSTADDIEIVSSPTKYADLVTTAIDVNIENSITTRKYLAVYKNGTDITKNATEMAKLSFGTGGSPLTTRITFTEFATTDVYDIYTPYNPAA